MAAGTLAMLVVLYVGVCGVIAHACRRRISRRSRLVEPAYRLQDVAQNAAAEPWILPGLGHTEGVSKMRETFLRRVVTFFAQSL